MAAAERAESVRGDVRGNARWGGRSGVTGIRILLVGVRSPINTGMILRVAETYEAEVALTGADDVLDDPARLQTIGDFSCGALARRGYARLSGPEAVRAWIQANQTLAVVGAFAIGVFMGSYMRG